CLVLLMPLHVGITIYRLATNMHFRDGAVDKELCNEIEIKRKEVEEFVTYHEEHPHEYELLAVEDPASDEVCERTAA
ncbi:UGT2A3, partial [Symbiodinium pilosum]